MQAKMSEIWALFQGPKKLPRVVKHGAMCDVVRFTLGVLIRVLVYALF